MHEVLLVVPTGVDGHAEVGHVRKLDLEDLGFFLGRDNVYHRNIQNGQPMRQLPFLVLILACCQSLSQAAGHTMREEKRQTKERSVTCKRRFFTISELKRLLSVIKCVPTHRISYVRIWYTFGLLSVLAARWIFSPTCIQFLIKCWNLVCDIRSADISESCQIFPDG